MSMYKKVVDAIWSKMPKVPIVHARPFRFSMALKNIGREELALVEFYLQFNYRPKLQQIFTKHMLENYQDWKYPSQFKDRRLKILENFPVNKYPTVYRRNQYLIAAGLEVDVNLN